MIDAQTIIQVANIIASAINNFVGAMVFCVIIYCVFGK